MHNDLDIGTVLDAMGERWAADLGAEPYTSNYFVMNKLILAGGHIMQSVRGAQRTSINPVILQIKMLMQNVQFQNFKAMEAAAMLC